MRIYPLHKDGRLTAFEIDNIYISVREVEQLLSTIVGVTELVRRQPFSRFDETHIKFKYQGVPFFVWEPFGDNSRYLIGPVETPGAIPDVRLLQAAFDNYQPSRLRKFLVGLLIFDLAGLLHRR
jgi:hypothetical protein